MIEFYHRNRPHESKPAPAGSPVEDELIYNPEGCGTLEKIGEVRAYDLIQSYKQETDINYLVQRYMAGDTSVLAKVQGLYADISDAPETLIEAQNRIKESERIFYSLPDEVKKVVGNAANMLEMMAQKPYEFSNLLYKDKKNVQKENIIEQEANINE